MKNNNVILVLSDKLLFPKHIDWVNYGWEYMLENIQIELPSENQELKKQNLSLDQQKKVLIAKKGINQQRESPQSLPCEIDLGSGEKYPLQNLPKNPKELIKYSLQAVKSELSDSELDLANRLYLLGYIKGIEEQKKNQQIELGDLTLELRKISGTDFIRAPEKREKVPSLENPEHKDEKELMITENKALGLNPIFNFGIDSEGRRKDGLLEKLNEYQKISIFMSDDEAKKILKCVNFFDPSSDNKGERLDHLSDFYKKVALPIKKLDQDREGKEVEIFISDLSLTNSGHDLRKVFENCAIKDLSEFRVPIRVPSVTPANNGAETLSQEARVAQSGQLR